MKRDVTSIVIYRAECTCGETYIEETKRNFPVRRAENESKFHHSEPIFKSRNGKCRNGNGERGTGNL